ncbi:prostate stem cell antigen-like isoform X1 [Protopterus annectens]|uniref:prostate stem cell antigen-like isoform X1 n=1 Tax=Protopterus annectens TaxID=7888 RepID=UPI001CFA2CAB|nr:prostate stem cell antigen-like isoform X1 [Protopterus annectens]
MKNLFNSEQERQMTMSSLLVIIFTAVLFATSVHSLQCYTCSTYTTRDQCITNVTCTADDIYCSTVATTVGFKTYVLKGCAAICLEVTDDVSFDYSIEIVKTACCSTDLCNSSMSVNLKCKLLLTSAFVMFTVLKFVF